MVFAPLYVSRLGKGQVVSMGWSFWHRAPQVLQANFGLRFEAAAVRWIVSKRGDGQTPAAAPPVPDSPAPAPDKPH